MVKVVCVVNGVRKAFFSKSHKKAWDRAFAYALHALLFTEVDAYGFVAPNGATVGHAYGIMVDYDAPDAAYRFVSDWQQYVAPASTRRHSVVIDTFNELHI